MQSPAPPPDLRRIVAGQRQADAVIQSDSLMRSQGMTGVEGLRVGTIWLTGPVPVNDNNNDEDGATRDIADGLVVRNGTALRYTDLAPGAITPMHRTSSIDFNILVQGELTLIMEDGTETHLKTPGEVVVQKGNMHAWRNPGKEWTRWVTTLLAAEPAMVDGQPLEEAPRPL